MTIKIERRSRTSEKSRASLEQMARTVAWWYINTDMSFDSSLEYVQSKTIGFDQSSIAVCRELAELMIKGKVRYCETRIVEDEIETKLLDCRRKVDKPAVLISRFGRIAHRKLWNIYYAETFIKENQVHDNKKPSPRNS